MSQNFQIIQLTIDQEALKKASSRNRNQLIGCMHANNELAALNRIFLFSLNDTGEGELHDSAHSIQMWCLLQVLSSKLFEAWNMLSERFLKAKPEDPALGKLSASHKASLNLLIDYFGKENNPLRIIRDKTGFHYDKLNLDAPWKISRQVKTTFISLNILPTAFIIWYRPLYSELSTPRSLITRRALRTAIMVKERKKDLASRSTM